MNLDDLFGEAARVTMDPFSLGAYLGARGLTREGDEEASRRALEVFYHFNVMPRYAFPANETDRHCPHCGHPLGTTGDRTAGVVGWRFECKRNVGGCGRRFTATTNTLLHNMRLRELGVDTILKMLFLWLEDTQQNQVRSYTGVAQDTVVAWFAYFRDVASKIAWHDFERIGGQGDVVEIDETHVFKRKNNRGRLARWQRFWVFGGISRTSSKVFGTFVPNRSLETLLPIMQDHIDEASYICSDEWAAYNADVAAVFAGLGRVNHTRNWVFPPANREPLWVPEGQILYETRDKQFVGPWREGMLPFRHHTQKVENSWRQLKRVVSAKTRVDHAEKYVGEWMYRRNILRDFPDTRQKLERFLRDCSRAYPGVGRGAPMSDDLDICQCQECHPPA